MVFTEDEERQIRGMLALHMQRMRTHNASFKMEGKELTSPQDPLVQNWKAEEIKCRQEIDKIISDEGL